jgi:high-affinity iron transporter
MLLTFLIAFREGLEAFLMVGILISYLGKIGAGRYVKWIYVGVAAGLLASVVAAFLFQVVVDQFSSDQYRTFLMAGVMIAATLVLTYMALWMHKQAKAHTEHARNQLQAYVAASDIFGVAFLAFISVWREGLETVLFLSALAYGGAPPSALGGLLGLALAVAIVWMLVVGARRVPLQVFFRYTSLLLIIIAAGLLGSAINVLQTAGVIPGSTVPIFDVSSVLSDSSGVGLFLRGLFGYNASPTASQFFVWMIYLAVGITLWMRGYAAKA